MVFKVIAHSVWLKPLKSLIYGRGDTPLCACTVCSSSGEQKAIEFMYQIQIVSFGNVWWHIITFLRLIVNTGEKSFDGSGGNVCRSQFLALDVWNFYGCRKNNCFVPKVVAQRYELVLVTMWLWSMDSSRARGKGKSMFLRCYLLCVWCSAFNL